MDKTVILFKLSGFHSFIAEHSNQLIVNMYPSFTINLYVIFFYKQSAHME